MQTILDILRKAGGWHPGLYLKIDNPPYLELVIEAMDESGPMGLPAISVAHYGQQNGDLMRDPEMCFELGMVGGIHLDPFYWRNDYVAVEQWNLLSLSAEANSYFRNSVADPLRFTLGGPLRLYASSIDEYRGTDTVLTRAIYLRRVAKLPTGLGQGVYLTTGYEAGSIWSPKQHSTLRQDIVGGVLLSTPFGAITVGGAIGDDDHRKIFFTFGKLFQ